LTVRVCYRRGDGARALREREWLVTNGLGGYASGTAGGELTRRFHGHLVAALPPPRGRMLAVSALEATGCGAAELEELRLELGLPVFRYRAVEKRVVLAHGRNLALVSYRALEPLTLVVRPGFQVRPHEGRVDAPARDYPLSIDGGVCEVDRGTALPIRLVASGGAWRAVPARVRTVRYEVEAERGYDCEGPLVEPCELTVRLSAGEEMTLALSTEAPDPGPDVGALRHAEEERRRALVADREGRVAELTLAADQFLVEKLHGAAGEHTVIAGYPWFTDWGRDTMISLEGLCLCTGRHAMAARILRTFAGHLRDGLIPNLFPEGDSRGLYHTADATLWFFHAIDRYTAVTRDETLLADLLPALRTIVRAHLRGTRFGIGVDPADGLLRQGADGYQLTWMDAKVGDWVVTPRRGKAVEINALFYNALRLLDRWAPGDEAVAGAAVRLRRSFNARFVAAGRDHLLDVVDPDDASLRPNQLLAVALPNPVLDRAHWAAMLRAVRRELLTPVGLRSLGPREPAYRPRYEGDLRARDAAYHQGTVWAWLIGPFVDAWRKVFPEDDVGGLLAGFDAGMGEYGLGTIAEIFDAEAPHRPRGCFAQAWSVAEVLRCSLSR
jgi:glycogen debranching enzyme